MSEEEIKNENDANEYASGMMGIGDYDEKWHYNDKLMYNNLKRAFKAGRNTVTYAQPVPVKPEDEKVDYEFLHYVRGARQQFVNALGNVERSNYLMTEVDSFLIAYDQMKERLSSLPPAPVKAVEDGMNDIQQAYNDSWKSKDEVDYDAEGHPHYYDSMDYERKLDHETFGKEVEQIYLTWLEKNQAVEGETITGVEEAAEEWINKTPFDVNASRWENRTNDFRGGVEWLANKLK